MSSAPFVPHQPLAARQLEHRLHETVQASLRSNPGLEIFDPGTSLQLTETSLGGASIALSDAAGTTPDFAIVSVRPDHGLSAEVEIGPGTIDLWVRRNAPGLRETDASDVPYSLVVAAAEYPGPGPGLRDGHLYLGRFHMEESGAEGSLGLEPVLHGPVSRLGAIPGTNRRWNELLDQVGGRIGAWAREVSGHGSADVPFTSSVFELVAAWRRLDLPELAERLRTTSLLALLPLADACERLEQLGCEPVTRQDLSYDTAEEQLRFLLKTIERTEEGRAEGALKRGVHYRETWRADGVLEIALTRVQPASELVIEFPRSANVPRRLLLRCQRPFIQSDLRAENRGTEQRFHFDSSELAGEEVLELSGFAGGPRPPSPRLLTLRSQA